MKTSKERKETPIFSGVLNYFPLAIAGVAQQSFKGNEKHNPGEPLGWTRNKSSDHLDCIVRHVMTPREIDPETNLPHIVSVAWRALAQAELILEEMRDAESATGARVPSEVPFFGVTVPIEDAFCIEPVDEPWVSYNLTEETYKGLVRSGHIKPKIETP